MNDTHGKQPETPDLQTQLESLLDCVWRAQRAWEQENRWELRLALIDLRRAS